MELRFSIDPGTDEPHIYNHGVTEDEVSEVLTNSVENRRGRERSWVAIGQTSAGRYLRVIYVPDQGRDSAFVVTAYEVRGKQLAAYRRRRRRKQQ